MSRALIVFTGERTPMLYSGTVWRLINQNPRTLFPYPLKPSMFPQICALYVVLNQADSIASTYSYSESGYLDTGSPAYGSIDIVSVGTLLSVSVFWTSIPDSTHLLDIKILVCAHPGIALLVCNMSRYRSSDISQLVCNMSRYRSSDISQLVCNIFRYRSFDISQLVCNISRCRL